MDPLYRESRPILPRNLAYLSAAVLIATLAFMVFSEYVLDAHMPSWTIPVTAVVFVIIIVVLLVLRMDLEVYPDKVVITHAFRKTVVEGREILDVRSGDLTEIRNYGGWNLKGVKHRTFSRIGDDEGEIQAGMSGSSYSDVRIWAGSTSTERNSAPFRVLQDGTIYASKGIFSGFLQIPFKRIYDAARFDREYNGCRYYTVTDYFNIETGVQGMETEIGLTLPNDDNYDGIVLNIYDNPEKTRSSPLLCILGDGNNIFHPDGFDDAAPGLNPVKEIRCMRGGYMQLLCVRGMWIVTCNIMPNAVLLYQ